MVSSFFMAAQMWRMILAGTASPRSPAVTGQLGGNVVEILVEGLGSGAFPHAEITNPLHERLAAADLVGQPAEEYRHLLAAPDRVFQADGLEQGEIHQIVRRLSSRKGHGR